MSSCRDPDRNGDPESVTFDESERQTIETLSPLPDVPRDETNRVSGDDGAAHLGRFLFFDERLSGNGDVACADCHRPNHGFSVPTRLGHGLGSTKRHPPSLVNVAYHSWFDWDGKADTLWSQAARPLENPNEQGSSRTAIAKLVERDGELERAYEAVFGELPDLSSDERYPPEARPAPDTPNSPAHRAWLDMSNEDRRLVTRIFTNLTKAIASYEERLVSREAPFDRFAQGLTDGDPSARDAISAKAQRGLKLFVGRARCINCHNGPNFSDGTFHNVGLEPRPWLDRRDVGRWRGVERVRQSPLNATGPFSDARDGRRAKAIEYLHRTSEARGQFKTPTLRNVARTPPYMHGGHFDTLESVVEFYSALPEQPAVGHREESLEPLGLTPTEIDELVAFLRTLSGERPPAELLHPPESPIPPGER